MFTEDKKILFMEIVTCDSMGNNSSDVSTSPGVPVLTGNCEKLGDHRARALFNASEHLALLMPLLQAAGLQSGGLGTSVPLSHYFWGVFFIVASQSWYVLAVIFSFFMLFVALVCHL